MGGRWQVTLYFDGVGDPVEGQMVTGTGQVIGFTGWLALVSALERALEGARAGD